jgi:hypothetical protein
MRMQRRLDASTGARRGVARPWSAAPRSAALLSAVTAFALSAVAADPPGPGTPENRTEPPKESAEFTERARSLFDAIVKDAPELADAFFFPREPFLPLKDVRDPAKYYAELLRVYRHDVHELHAARRSWAGAVFRGIELGSEPKWVKPGDEWNKIGYFRTFDAKLSYDLGGRTRVLGVRTIISWDGKWYATHLLPIAHDAPKKS